MTAQVFVSCTADGCRLRFPVPVGHERHGLCPKCGAPTVDVATVPTGGAAGLGVDGKVGSATMVAVFDNIRSALNVGSMLRTADGVGVGHVHLCGVTPDGDNEKVAKTALGAEASVGWSAHPDAVSCCVELQADGWSVWAVESTSSSVPLGAVVGEVPDRLALVVGNEVAGVDPGVLDLADRHVHLPMAGSKSSLNVSVAFGAAAYLLRNGRVLNAHWS